MAATDRKYALTKIKPGDWLLPSNDGQTIWRINRYTDGFSSGLDFPDRDYWAIWKYVGKPGFWSDDWNDFEHVEGLHDTRAAAIASALRLSSTPPVVSWDGVCSHGVPMHKPCSECPGDGE